MREIWRVLGVHNLVTSYVLQVLLAIHFVQECGYVSLHLAISSRRLICTLDIEIVRLCNHLLSILLQWRISYGLLSDLFLESAQRRHRVDLKGLFTEDRTAGLYVTGCIDLVFIKVL